MCIIIYYIHTICCWGQNSDLSTNSHLQRLGEVLLGIVQIVNDDFLPTSDFLGVPWHLTIHVYTWTCQPRIVEFTHHSPRVHPEFPVIFQRLPPNGIISDFNGTLLRSLAPSPPWSCRSFCPWPVVEAVGKHMAAALLCVYTVKLCISKRIYIYIYVCVLCIIIHITSYNYLCVAYIHMYMCIYVSHACVHTYSMHNTYAWNTSAIPIEKVEHMPLTVCHSVQRQACKRDIRWLSIPKSPME